MRFFHGFDSDPQPDITIGSNCSLGEFRDAVFVPDYSALYDADGKRIGNSVVVRKHRGVVSLGPQHLSSADLNGIKPVDRAMFIGSLGFDQYGHYITEQIARLWPLPGGEFSDWPLVFHCGRPMVNQRIPHYEFSTFLPYQKAVLEAIPGFSADRLLFARQPLRISRAILPEASFVTRASACAGHVRLTHCCAENVLRGKDIGGDRRLYFSRTALGNELRKVDGELQFEQILAKDYGFEIIHAQQRDFSQQVALINSARVVAGTVGSALHNLLFSLVQDQQLICFCDSRPNENYFLVDALLNGDAHYLRCISEFEQPKQHVSIDIPTALRYLNEIL